MSQHRGRAAEGDAALGLGTAYATLGRPADARRAFAQARAAYRAAEHHFMLGLLAGAELDLVALAYEPERVAARRALATEIAQAMGRASGIGVASPDLFRVSLLLLEGQWADARAIILERSRAGYVVGGHDRALVRLGYLARAQGEPDLARAQVRATMPAGPTTAPGESAFDVAVETQRLAAVLALDTGELATARAWLEAHDRWLARGEAVLGRAEGQLGWAAYHRATGNSAAAGRAAEQALAHASAPRQPLALLAAHRTLGELATEARRHTDAAAHLDEALALADACAAPYEHALTLLALAELRAVTGQQAAARALLDEARAMLEPLEARPALARAEALRAKLAPDATPVYPPGLTAREVEVLRLVAEGLTDIQVAERLFISTNTAKTHLRSIYSKLGVPSRTAAARFATDHGLA